MRWSLAGAVLATCILSTSACFPTPGYRRLTERDVMGNMDLVILGSFLSQQNTTQDINGTTRYILRLDTQVDCVLRNMNKLTVGRNIKITEVRFGSWDGFMCKDYFNSIRFNSQAVIGITVLQEEHLPGEFTFDGHNLQGGAYYTDELDIDKVMEVCGFQSPQVPPGGGTCPNVLAADRGCYIPSTSGVGMVKAAASLLLSLLLSLFVFACFLK